MSCAFQLLAEIVSSFYTLNLHPFAVMGDVYTRTSPLVTAMVTLQVGPKSSVINSTVFASWSLGCVAWCPPCPSQVPHLDFPEVTGYKAIWSLCFGAIEPRVSPFAFAAFTWKLFMWGPYWREWAMCLHPMKGSSVDRLHQNRMESPLPSIDRSLVCSVKY